MFAPIARASSAYLRDQRARHGSGLLEPDFEQNEATLADNEVVVDT